MDLSSWLEDYAETFNGLKLSVLMNFATQLTERQNVLNQRLLQVFRQNVAIKENNERLRSEVLKTLSRADRVSSHTKDNQKLTAEEARLFAKLKECRAKMLSNSMKVSKVWLPSAQVRARGFGIGMRHFTPFTDKVSFKLE
ncbi:hypothetical protein TELCIR_14251 [Teladorsagia circumcincta]|uniref:Uncharacterized protein n=1 Tax=Teladorsagia circumcincta TaxID=45464 RepID=A0A2G9U3P6_TELCI|nr:hypothetical protein TELCIR_14251 [Teladorsagia circumcincta]